jgi:hypothetical protein
MKLVSREFLHFVFITVTHNIQVAFCPSADAPPGISWGFTGGQDSVMAVVQKQNLCIVQVNLCKAPEVQLLFQPAAVFTLSHSLETFVLFSA